MNLTDLLSKSIDYWSQKPSWCQPWSILIFGSLILVINFYLINNIIINIIIAFVIVLWWLLFLIIAPLNN